MYGQITREVSALFWLTVLLAVVIGLSLGMLGGGGSILTVPLLVYVAGQSPNTAVATSLLVVGTTAAIGAVGHARSGNVDWRTALVFGAAGMAGAYPGGRLGAILPGTVLLLLFAALLVVTAGAMLRPGGSRADQSSQHLRLPVLHVVAHGLVVGAVTGVVGAGGGFLVVPALVVLGGLPMHVAVGSSLVVIAMKSAAGFAGYASGVTLDWRLAIGVTVAAALGTIVGGRLANRLDASSLRRGFGWFVLGVGQTVVVAEVPADLRPWALAGAVLLTAGFVWWRRRATRDEDTPADDDTTTPALERSAR